MDKKAVVVELRRDGTTVYFKVDRMAEPLRGKGVLIKKGWWSIESHIFPHMQIRTLFLNGEDRSCDGESDEVTFATDRGALEYVSKMKELLEELNDGLQCCGHPKSSIAGEGLTHWCEECA